MTHFWRRPEDPVERELRHARPIAPEALVHSLTQAVTPQRPRSQASSRVAFAAAFVTFVVGLTASFGGVGYAASAATTTANLMKRVVVHQGPVVRAKSSAQDQYKPGGGVAGATKTPKTVKRSGVAGVAGAVRPAVVRGQLPFTGLSLAVTTFLALTLVAIGFVLRRRGRETI